MCGLMLLCFLLRGKPDTAYAVSVVPSLPRVAYTNSINFNFNSNVFDFFYQGADGSLVYEYAPKANGSIHQLSCKINGPNVFLPSAYGGLSLISNNVEIYPWSTGVSFKLLNIYTTNANTLVAQWQMSSGTNRLVYGYQFSMAGRTLTIQVNATEGISGGVDLDRCENATSPVIVRVPELTTMNVLLANGNFTSLFFDWEQTDASTIYPLDLVYSSTSVYYAQRARHLPLTDGTRRRVTETIYLTVSPSLTDVLPNVPNPVSPYKDLVAQYLVFDRWGAAFSAVQADLQAMVAAGIAHLWLITHEWQNGGYDNAYPDVLPAYSIWGGDAGLQGLSQYVRRNGGLFSLHENYIDFYPNAPSWNTNALALNSDASFKLAWTNKSTHIQSYEMKPSLAANYLTTFASQIHSNYNTTASFLDVHSAVNPSGYVDYAASTTNAGMFRETLARYRELARLLRNIHQGPVSGEGYSHFLNVGYFDDIEAQLNTSRGYSFPQGSWLPLLVDFDLLKMHDKALNHGVGYYERFFCATDGSSQFSTFSCDAVLEYMATELAYGRGGFIPTPSRVYDFVDVARLEQRHVLPVQKLYANATAANILYRDTANGDLLSASDYIRRYPTTFADISSSNFLSQVQVTYNNGLIVCVNRHPSLPWPVTLGYPGGWFNYNAVMSGTNCLWTGITNQTSYMLPPTNGWVVFAPKLDPPTPPKNLRAN